MHTIPVTHDALRQQLLDRRSRLRHALAATAGSPEFLGLLREVDGALERVEAGSFGLCDACHDPIETERWTADPLVRLCLGCLSPGQRRALEQDLERAAAIQAALLPPRDLRSGGWEIHYHYEPVGPVSGDFCDVIPAADGNGDVYFFVGDVAGKGVSASILMSHLQAILRGLVAAGGPLTGIVVAANRMLAGSTLPGHYASVACGRAGVSGEIEILNAGHCAPLLLSGGESRTLPANGLPLGMFSTGSYHAQELKLQPGDAMLLYTDGLSEAHDAGGREYGVQRLARRLERHPAAAAPDLARACIADLERFRRGSPGTDDLTVMAVRRDTDG